MGGVTNVKRCEDFFDDVSFDSPVDCRIANLELAIRYPYGFFLSRQEMIRLLKSFLGFGH